jgi:NCAIR mutase (PurE)-related protein
MLRINALAIVDEIAKLEINRDLRRGVPEIIYAAGKSCKQLKAIVTRILRPSIPRRSTPIILSKVKEEQYECLRDLFRENRKLRGLSRTKLELHKDAGIVVLTKNLSSKRQKLEHDAGRVALLAAGTSDIPAITEAQIVLGAMHCECIVFNDVGVATLARLTKPLRAVERFDPDVLIVAAGMEAALPSLIAGLSGVPVIGLPTSVGYGYGKGGEAALMSMLQACPLGIGVVNIDGGVAAGVVAGLIANRCASQRRR